MTSLKNLWIMFAKILFAKFSSVSKVKFVEKILRKFWRYFGEGIGGISRKVWEDFLEILWKFHENVMNFKEIFGRICWKWILNKIFTQLKKISVTEIYHKFASKIERKL